MSYLHGDGVDVAARLIEDECRHTAHWPVDSKSLGAVLDRQLAWRDVLRDQRDVLGLELSERVDRVEWLDVRGVRADVVFLRERPERHKRIMGAIQHYTTMHRRGYP